MNKPAGNMESRVPRHPVRVVAQRTGLTSHVLRAWERRYGVVAPTRSEGGQRLYSEADIERLTLLRRLTALGGAISQLAPLPAEDLARLVEEHGATPLAVGAGPDDRDVSGWREAALSAIGALDGAALRRELERSVVALGIPRALDGVMAPMLVEIGQRWQDGALGIAHEHLATAVIRQVLGWVRETAETTSRAPSLVVATPPGQVHEGGALLVAAAAAALGWRVTYLGADLPVNEIAGAAHRAGARAVALSLIHPADDPSVATQLAALRRALPPELPLLVGGAAAESYRAGIEAARGEVVTQLADLRTALGALTASE